MNKTKNIFKICVCSAVAVFAAACSGDYLEQDSTQYISYETLKTTLQKDEDKARAYITGAYKSLYDGGNLTKGHAQCGLPSWKLFTDLMAEDIAYNSDVTHFSWDYQLDWRLAEYGRPAAAWQQIYAIIASTNQAISELKPGEGQEPKSRAVKLILGQAYALRAYCYYWAVNLWQHPYGADKNALGVPLKTDTEYRTERVPVGKVYEQMVADLEQGYTYLKGEGFFLGKTTLTEYSVAGIYANVLMFMGDYQKAAEYAEKAISGGSLNTHAEITGGFNSLSMSEAIWGYDVNEETTANYASFFSHMDPYSGGYAGMGYRKLVSSEIYDRIYTSASDVRRAWCGINSQYGVVTKANFSNEQKAGLTQYVNNKFVDVYITSKKMEPSFTSDIIHMRIAEMYFVAAEAYYLAGNQTKAQDLLNIFVKTRDANYNFTGTGDDLYKEICMQKRIEMWGEGCRLFDAKRRNETIDRSKSTNHSATVMSDPATTTYSARDYRMILQIPLTEMENNPTITVNNE